jgi:hypothetical protein
MIHLRQKGGVLEADIRAMPETARRNEDRLWTISTNVLAVLASAMLLWQSYELLGS